MKWSKSELLHAKQMLESGKTYEEIGKSLNRTWSSIRNKLYNYYGIKRTDYYNAYIIKICLECNNEFTVTKGSDRKYDHRFCTRSCSTSYNNKNRILSTETKQKISKSLGGNGELQNTHCLNCNTKLFKNRRKYCNQKCKNEYTRNLIIKQWLNSEITGTCKGGSYQLLKVVREWVFERANHKCEECNNNDINIYTGNLILQVDHIDGDATNNRPSNLKILCPNCHAKTSTFGNTCGHKSTRGKYRKITRPY